MIRTNDPTYYEVECTNGTRHILVGFTRAPYNRHQLHHLLLGTVGQDTRIARVVAMTDTAPESWIYANRAADGVTSGPWRIRWTGRTERDAATGPALSETIYRTRIAA